MDAPPASPRASVTGQLSAVSPHGIECELVEDGGNVRGAPADRRGPTPTATLSMGLAGSWAAAVLVDEDEPARFNR